MSPVCAHVLLRELLELRSGTELVNIDLKYGNEELCQKVMCFVALCLVTLLTWRVSGARPGHQVQT